MSSHTLAFYICFPCKADLLATEWKEYAIIVELITPILSLDRVNIGQAKVAGLTTDLHLTNQEYQIALTVFFVSYVAVEVPSNLALKIFRPNRWIALNMLVLLGF